ncbi:MAG: rhodanese-like domain-containing protein [candidate division WOR-3 bacterium]
MNRLLMGLIGLVLLSGCPPKPKPPSEPDKGAIIREAVRGYLNEMGPDLNLMEMEDVKARMAELLIIDVRSPDDFEKINIPGSLNIPLKSLASDEALSILRRSQKDVVFVGEAGSAAAQAVALARLMDIKNAYAMTGGLDDWQRMKYPVQGTETAAGPGEPMGNTPIKTGKRVK